LYGPLNSGHLDAESLRRDLAEPLRAARGGFSEGLWLDEVEHP
jgi:hypothetical protein